MSAIQKSREQEKLRRATEKETWDNVSKFFEIDDAEKAVALQALQNKPVSTSRAGACFIFKQRYEIYLSAGKQYVDYAKVANLLIAEHKWPMEKCRGHLAMKLRQWHDGQAHVESQARSLLLLACQCFQKVTV